MTLKNLHFEMFGKTKNVVNRSHHILRAIEKSAEENREQEKRKQMFKNPHKNDTFKSDTSKILLESFGEIRTQHGVKFRDDQAIQVRSLKTILKRNLAYKF